MNVGNAVDRVEDLEEALRRIVTIVIHDGCHIVNDRELAVMIFALDVLGIDEPVLYRGRCTLSA